MTLRLLTILLAGALSLTACPRPSTGVRPDPKKTVPSGDPFPDQPTVEVKPSPEADAALEAAKTKAAALEGVRAAEVFLEVRRTFPATSAGQDALYRAGVLYFEAGDFALARKALNELLFENPLYENAKDAKYKVALAALEVGAPRDAYQTLMSLAEHASGAERLQLYEKAIEAAELAGLSGEALRLAVQLAGEATGAEAQRAALTRVERLIENRADFVDVARVVEPLSSGHPAWPLLTFKLARIYYHLRDWQNLEPTLQKFLREAPNHPFASRAQQMLERSTRRVQVNPRTVGVILPMSGRYKLLGEAVMRGISLGLRDSDIEVVVKDNQGDVMLAGKAVEDLAFDEGAIAAIGPLLGDDATRAAVVAEELQFPLLTLTRSENITAIGPHIFRNMLTNSAQADALADYATRILGYEDFGVLYPNTSYGVELTNAFWDALAERGGEVRGAESYDHDQTTFSTPVKKLVGRYYLEDRSDYLEGIRGISEKDAFRRRKAAEKVRGELEPIVDFEALFIPDAWSTVGLVAPALAVEDVITNACDPRDLERIRKTTGKKELKTVTLLGTNGWSSPKGRTGLPELLERGGKFVTCSVYVDGFYVDSNRKATRQFVEAYRQAYPELNRDPGLLEAIGYDSARMIRHLIETQKPQTREQLRTQLAALEKFEGATGTTAFNDQREAMKPLFFLSVESKGVRELDVPPPPSKRGTGSLQPTGSSVGAGSR